jgi:hypothetical protein
MASDKAEELKVHVAKTIFSEASADHPASDEAGNLLSQLSNLAKQLKSK